MTRILVVDDEPAFRGLMSLLLAGAGYEVLEAADGLDGLRQALEEQPDVVVCDIGVSGLRGYDLLTELRRHPTTASIPVIFLTEQSTREELRQGMELGADDYIAKPFAADELLRAVSARLARQQPAQENLRRTTRALDLIRGCSDLLVAAESEHQLLDGVCRLLVNTGGYRFAWVGHAERGARGQLRVAARVGRDACTDEGAIPPAGSLARSPKVTERALRSGLPVARRAGNGCGSGSTTAVPLLAGTRSFATLTLQSDDPGSFDEQEANLLTHLAGHLAYGIVTLRTRGERERAQAALDDLRHRNDLILNSAGEGICGTNSEGILTFANPAAETMLGWPRGTAVGHPAHDVFHGGESATHARADCPLEAIILAGASRRVTEEEFRRRDGTPIPVGYALAPIRENGGRAGTVIVFRDITERKRSERELAEAHESVLRAELDKKHFHREVVHAVTRGKLHLVDAEGVPELGRRVWRTTLKSVHSYPGFRHALTQLGEEMGMCERNLRDWVLASSEAAANALKHAGGGVVTVYADEGRGIVRIADRGSGIRPEDLSASIFEPGFSTAISLGMGFTLILQLSDEVWLATDPRGTTVQIARSFEPRPPITPLSLALQRL